MLLLYSFMTEEDCLKWETINIFHTASFVSKDEFPKFLTALGSWIKEKKIKEKKKDIYKFMIMETS